MAYINTTSHKKFISQCHTLIFGNIDVAQEVMKDEIKEQIKADINKLQNLVDMYKETLSRLPDLSREYVILQKRIRADIRKHRTKKYLRSTSGTF